MKRLTLSRILTLFLLFSFLGCETINPLCTENYCVEGEIYPKSELRVGAKYGELPIDDAVIFATLARTPPVKSKSNATFVSAHPPSGSTIAHKASITLIFNNTPASIRVSPGNARIQGRMVIVYGPFTPGLISLAVSWYDGSTTLTYTVSPPDVDPPKVIGGTVKDGDTDVNPEPLNTNGIEITFSEDVRGNIALQTEGGDDVGWLGKVEGNKGRLKPGIGKEIGNEMIYVIVGIISDAARNDVDIKITFVTKIK